MTKKSFDPDRKVEIIDTSTPEDLMKGIIRATVTMTIPVITIKFTIDEPLELPTEIKLE
jgi:hypothetical protein